MTQLVPRQQAVTTIRGLLEKSKDQIRLALPRHMSPDRMLRVALTAIQRNPNLLDCDPKSLIGAVMQAAQLGLEPDGLLGGAYLVPYGKQVTLIPGYKGLIDLARRSGAVSSIQAHVVNESDEFEFEYGLAPKLVHRPSRADEPGKMIAAYAVAQLKDGGTHFEVMWKRQIDAIRARSRAANAGPWVSDYDEMARKTVIRRHMKFLPLSVEVAKAVALDEMAEHGLPQNLHVLAEGEDAIDVTSEAPADMPAPKDDAAHAEADLEIAESETKAKGRKS